MPDLPSRMLIGWLWSIPATLGAIIISIGVYIAIYKIFNNYDIAFWAGTVTFFVLWIGALVYMSIYIQKGDIFNKQSDFAKQTNVSLESKEDVFDRLSKLKELHDKGVITTKEFEEKREKILDEL